MIYDLDHIFFLTAAPHAMLHWFEHYGSFTLFIFLALGVFAFPLPQESLLLVAGVLMAKGELNIPAAFISACAGSICGISLSYYLGHSIGKYFLIKYGSWLGLTEEKFTKAKKWFRRFGTWTLFFGYFIPGVRHFTGLMAGMLRLEFSRFALFSFSGAVLWVVLFLSIGYFFGDYGHRIFKTYETNLDLVILLMGLILLLSFIFKIIFINKKKP